MLAQFVLLPALTWALTMVLRPQPCVALGIILVACCPGGNISNFMTHLARGNTALSVTMTAVSTTGAIFMTPFNTALWGGLNPHTTAILREIAISPLDVFGTIMVMLAIPAVLGMTAAIVSDLRRPGAQAVPHPVDRDLRRFRRARPGRELDVLPAVHGASYWPCSWSTPSA